MPNNNRIISVMASVSDELKEIELIEADYLQRYSLVFPKFKITNLLISNNRTTSTLDVIIAIEIQAQQYLLPVW